jgi:hypothetical protein
MQMLMRIMIMLGMMAIVGTVVATSGSDDGIITLDDWTIITDADSVYDGESLCVRGQNSDSIWYYDAPQEIVDTILEAYGQTLTLNLWQAIDSPSQMTVQLVVGNAVVLGYALPENDGDDFIRYNIPLTTTAGWEDLDGMFDLSDVEMFQQLLSDVTRIQIFGEGEGVSCLKDAQVVRAPVAGEFVLYYLVNPEQDIDGQGIPVGCNGFMIPFETDIPLSDNPEENITVAMQQLLAPESLDDVPEGVMSYFPTQELVFNSVTVDDDGHAIVRFEGQLMLIGTCGDPHIEAQLLLSIFADPRIESALIEVNGENIRPFFDMSGEMPLDAIYTRDNIGIRFWSE